MHHAIDQFHVTQTSEFYSCQVVSSDPKWPLQSDFKQIFNRSQIREANLRIWNTKIVYLPTAKNDNSNFKSACCDVRRKKLLASHPSFLRCSMTENWWGKTYCTDAKPRVKCPQRSSFIHSCKRCFSECRISYVFFDLIFVDSIWYY